MIDANLNRSREAIRVLEDYARFVLDDLHVADAAKHLRHDLAAAVERHALGGFIRARNITGDVGRDLRTDREYQRFTARHVITAAAKRLSEAFRVIEEYAKTISPAFAAEVEQLRYRGYELERQLAARLEAADRVGRVRLYVIITASLCRGDWLETAAAALDGGADCLQLREKHLSDRELLDRARRLTQLCGEHEALCVINDRPDVAVLADAHGVHVGQDDLSVGEARRIVGPDRIVGASTHTIEQFESAAATSPDYVAVGPMFATETKPQDHIAGPELLAQAAARSSLPIVPIGGITTDSVPKLVAAGAQRVCVCSAVISNDDPRAAAAALKATLPADSRPSPAPL